MEEELALNVASCSTWGTVLLGSPKLLCSLESAHVPMARWSKLELLQHLLKRGWRARPVADVPKVFQRGGEKIFPIEHITQPKSYLQCLAMEAFIFKKPGGMPSIAHKGSDKYYRALLAAKDLRKLAVHAAALGDEVGERAKAEDRLSDRPNPNNYEGWGQFNVAIGNHVFHAPLQILTPITRQKPP